MISLSYNVRISRRGGYTPPPRLFDFQAQPTPPTGPKDYLPSVGEVSPQTPLWEAIFPSKEDNPTSPVVQYGLSIEELNERVLTPFREWRDIRLDGHTIPYSAIERIEIKTEEASLNVPLLRNSFLDFLRQFEWSGTDITGEFIKDPPAWGPSIGAPEQPELIPIDQLYDRLITNDHLRQATRSRFRSRNFADAVEAAYKCLANAVKERSDHRERDGADLMRHVFSEKSPLLRLNALQSRSDKDEHNGYRDIFAGVMIGIRNPRAHEPGIKDNPSVALELLTLANHLMRKLDAVTKNGTQSEGPTL